MDREPTTGGHPDTDSVPAIVRDEPVVSRREQLRRSLRNLALAMAAVAGVGLLSGWLFARSAPQTAAAASISALVEPAAVPAEDAIADPRCGVVDPGGADLDAVRAAGVVVLEVDPGWFSRQALLDLVDGRAALIVWARPDAGVIEASSTGRRMVLDEPNRAALDAYLTAYARPGACG